MIVREMIDPFQGAAIQERIAKVVALALLLALLCAIYFLQFSTVVAEGRPVKAEVLHIGTYPAGRAAGGDLPILSVRLPDGSVRAVRATWPDVNNCTPGRWISIVVHGTAVQVGVPGCVATH